jgi:integrase/recombinase XerD
MYTRFFTHPTKRLRAGPANAFIDGFAEELHRHGYSRPIACIHLRAAVHFGCWAEQQGIGIKGLDDSSLADFRAHLPSCRCGNSYRDQSAHVVAGARHFLEYLRRCGTVRPAFKEVEEFRGGEILEEFDRWMDVHRGLRASTRQAYRSVGKELLLAVGPETNDFTPEALRRFILERVQHHGAGAGARIVRTLRLFVRFLTVAGKCCPTLVDAIPTVLHRRLASLPRYLAPADVEAIVATCDAATPRGNRDRAIVLLCARLGLRASDITRLCFTDLDWEGASMCVEGKGRRQVRLPLTQELGDALVSYIEHGRPAVEGPHFFTTCRAPYRALAGASSVSTIVARAIRRAGVRHPSRGAAHLLRHSAATEMLRQGIGLHDIGAVLRHRSIESTAHYAKVDVNALGRVAQPWPEDQP